MISKFRYVTFGVLVLTITGACTSEERSLTYQGPLGTVPLEGNLVDAQVYSSLTAKRKAQSKVQVCKGLEESRTGRQLYFVKDKENEVAQEFENMIYSCPIQFNWIDACIKVGTYQGNRLTMRLEVDADAQVYDFEVQRRDRRTIEYTKVFIDEEELALESIFPDSDMLFIKQVSPGEVDAIQEIKETCR